MHRMLFYEPPLHRRSTETEVREILALALKPETRVRMGDALATIRQVQTLTN